MFPQLLSAVEYHRPRAVAVVVVVRPCSLPVGVCVFDGLVLVVVGFVNALDMDTLGDILNGGGVQRVRLLDSGWRGWPPAQCRCSVPDLIS